MSQAFLCLSAFANREEARRVAETAVSEHLAACANLLPQIESIYRWKGKIERSDETLVFFKTTRERLAELEARIKSLHSYETPEFIALEIDSGSPAYLQWIAENCA